MPSANNPADGPSRGWYLAQSLMLPAVPILQEIAKYIIDVNECNLSAEQDDGGKQKKTAGRGFERDVSTLKHQDKIIQHQIDK